MIFACQRHFFQAVWLPIQLIQLEIYQPTWSQGGAPGAPQLNVVCIRYIFRKP